VERYTQKGVKRKIDCNKNLGILYAPLGHRFNRNRNWRLCLVHSNVACSFELIGLHSMSDNTLDVQMNSTPIL